MYLARSKHGSETVRNHARPSRQQILHQDRRVPQRDQLPDMKWLNDQARPLEHRIQDICVSQPRRATTPKHYLSPITSLRGPAPIGRSRLNVSALPVSPPNWGPAERSRAAAWHSDRFRRRRQVRSSSLRRGRVRRNRGGPSPAYRRSSGHRRRLPSWPRCARRRGRLHARGSCRRTWRGPYPTAR